VSFLVVAGCCSESKKANISGNLARNPTVRIRPASAIQFRGGNSKSPAEPGDTDCNSPAHWDDGVLYLFNSSGHPWRSSGPDLFSVTNDYRRCEYNNTADGGRWIECTWKAKDGTLYGWYHFEPRGICPGAHPDPKMNLTAPRIGAARSLDNGATWVDLGVVLDSIPAVRCDTKNYYFAGGNGDFCAMLDSSGTYLYFFISTYAGDLSEQGVAVGRMRWADRDAPVGKVTKFYKDGWNEPGLGGRVSAIFPARIDWHQTDADAFWGPSVHWNSYSECFVMLLNRTKDSRWTQEGVYVSFNRDLANTTGWSEPAKILESQGADRWYPQVLGIDKQKLETDKLAGKVARLFLRGVSRWELVFDAPPPK